MSVKIIDFFKAGPEKPVVYDKSEIESKYNQYRREILASIILLYGFGYTCRLALSVVKKPLIDSGIFSILDLVLLDLLTFMVMRWENF